MITELTATFPSEEEDVWHSWSGYATAFLTTVDLMNGPLAVIEAPPFEWKPFKVRFTCFDTGNPRSRSFFATVISPPLKSDALSAVLPPPRKPWAAPAIAFNGSDYRCEGQNNLALGQSRNGLKRHPARVDQIHLAHEEQIRASSLEIDMHTPKQLQPLAPPEELKA